MRVSGWFQVGCLGNLGGSQIISQIILAGQLHLNGIIVSDSQLYLNSMNSEGSRICVAIRKRPINRKEQVNGETDIVLVRNGETVIVSQYKQKVDLTKYIEESAFNFDYAFDQSCDNEHIYCKAVRPLLENAFLGARVTCFAYGQTGSGKTYTMNGDIKQGVPGIYTLGAHDIFGYRSNKQYSHLKVTVSFFEIYCGRLFDLLNNRTQLKIREDNKQNIHIVGLKEDLINTPEEFMKVIEYGSNFRVTSQNSTNADSSRSHAILQICLKEGKKIYGKISFIDLAGCERGADHMDQNKQTRIDGAEISKSLLSLKECIRALDQGKGHTPFRGSKLTMVLKDSFVGFCMTVMIGNISPNINSCENTLNTLRYADRVKQLKKPNGGNEPLSKEDQLAKELMLPRNGKNAVKIMISNDDDAEDIMNKKIEAQKMLGIKTEQPRMMVEQPINSKNGALVQKQAIKRLESQDAKVLNKGYQNIGISSRNEPGLFDNSKTVQMRPKQSAIFPQHSQNQGQRAESSYAAKSSSKTNDLKGSMMQNQNFNQNQNIVGNQQFIPQQSQYNPKLSAPPSQQFNQPAQYNPHNYQQNNQHYHSSNGVNQQHNQPPPQQSFGSQAFQRQQSYQQPSIYSSPQPEPFNSYQRRHSYKTEGDFQFQQHTQFQSQHQPSQNVFRQPTPQNSNPSQSLQSYHQKSGQTPMMVEDDVKNCEPAQWKSAVQQFKQWGPTSNLAQIKYFRDVHEFLIGKLVEEEDLLTSEHSLTINREIETIKGEMKFIQEIEKNKAAYESIQYAEFVEDMIDRKISALVKLKKRVNKFKEHLIEHQECEQKIFMVQQQISDQPDELLLDNLGEDY